MAGGEGGVKGRDFRLGFVVQRWRHAFWICPLLSTLAGAVLFHAFLVGQPEEREGFIPSVTLIGTDYKRDEVMAYLSSDEAMAEVAEAMVANGWVRWMPTWDLRRRTTIQASGAEFIEVLVRHPSKEVASRLARTFAHRGSYYYLEVLEPEAEGEETQRCPDGDPRPPNEEDCMMLLAEIEGEVPLGHTPLPTWSPRPALPAPPWWQRIPASVLFIGKWFVGGVLAAVPIAYLLECQFPRRGS